MNKKCKIISIIFISLLMISGVYAQTAFLTLNTTDDNRYSEPSKENTLKSPRTSDVSGSYDWHDGTGNSMDIEAIDNTTTTTINNNIDGEYLTIESEKNDTYMSTEFNGTNSISCEEFGQTPFQLHSPYYDAYIPDINTLDIQGPDYEMHTYALKNDVENSLDYFYAQSRNKTNTRFFNMTYIKDSGSGFDLNLLIGDASGQFDVNLDYDNEANEFKWRDETFDINPLFDPTYNYIINITGVYQDGSQAISWEDSSLQQYIGTTMVGSWIVYITKRFNTIIFHYYSPLLDQDLYEMIFTKNYDGIITMNFNLLSAPVSFYWCQQVITYYNPIGEKAMIFTFYLWDIFDLLYSIMWESAYFEVKFLWERMVIVWGYIIIELWINIDLLLIEIIISFHWAWWSFKIQIWVDAALYLFRSYLVWIEYHYDIYHWIYSFYVPTLVLPNFLTINIIESIYTDSGFYITIKVTDYLSNAIAGATITGTWDGDSIGTVDDNDDGTYNFTLQAKYIESGENPLWLNLTASKPGYTNGALNTEISVESPTIPEVTKKLKINIINSVYASDWFNFTVKITNCSGDLELGTSLSGTWDINALGPENITNNNDGTFDLCVTPIFIIAPTPGIWLNLTATKPTYDDGKLNTQIAVESGSIPIITPNILALDIVKQIFSEDWFNFTFYVYNASNPTQGIVGANIDIWWNGTDVSSYIIPVIGENGNYSISLIPMTVDPSEDPIKLNIVVDKLPDFEPSYHTFYIGVDPDVIDKEIKGIIGPPPDDDDDDDGKEEELGFLGPTLIIVGISLAIGVAAVAIYLFRKRRLIR
ncbi:MAG: hypothetical protein ACFFDH_22455 [Promethearchaeota archaeon]